MSLNKKQMLSINNDLVDLLKTTDDIIYFVPNMEEINDNESMYNEYELLGYFVSKHPLDDYKTKISQLEKIKELKEKKAGSRIHVGGIISSIKHIRTKKTNAQMAVFTLEDTSGRISVTVFPKTFERCVDLMDQNTLVEVKGRIEIEERNINEEMIKSAKVIATSIFPLERAKELEKIFLRLSDGDDFEKIKNLLIKNKGHIPVIVDYHDCLMETPYKIPQKQEVLDELRRLTLLHEVELNSNISRN